MSDVADKLREARALIERGWTRGEFERAGRVCLLGAVNRVAPVITLRIACLDTLSEVISGVPYWGSALAQWNDAQPSKKPVLAAFDKAIELAEKSA